MANKLMSDELKRAMKQYCGDRMYYSVVQDVGKDFLEATGHKSATGIRHPEVTRVSITGIRYTTLAMLLAQAMQDLMAGYGGHTTRDRSLLHEAIGYQLAIDSEVTANAAIAPLTPERYFDIVMVVHDLQQTEPKFAEVIHNFLEYFK